jgi:ABC transporter with metal-binding/Fe-S-binding domain ATP-binding protein
LNLASLFSGGKDSTFSIFKTKQNGHNIVCLVSLYPESAESHLLHHPNISWTSLQAESMKIPHLSILLENNDEQNEIEKLEELLKKAKREFGIEGLVHGGILSEYQKNRFESIGKKLNLHVVSPIWHIDDRKYLAELLDSGFRFIVTSVTAAGLDDSWLGKEITTKEIQTLDSLSSKYGFHLAFEGGEAETFVIDCPLFSHPIKIVKANKIWDGYRGRFEITEAILDK